MLEMARRTTFAEQGLRGGMIGSDMLMQICSMAIEAGLVADTHEGLCVTGVATLGKARMRGVQWAGQPLRIARKIPCAQCLDGLRVTGEPAPGQ